MSENPYDASPSPTEADLAANSGCASPTVTILVGLGVVALLFLLFLPAFNRGPEPAHRTKCMNNLKMLMLAMHNYHDKHGHFPPAHTMDDSGNRLHSWRTLLLPYLEQQALYETIDIDKPWDHPNNAVARETVVAAFQCPSTDLKPGFTTYVGLVGPDAFFSDDGTTRQFRDLTGGTSNTFAITEVSPESAIHWMDPNNSADGLRFLRELADNTPTAHRGGVEAALADGSVRFVSPHSPMDIVAATTIHDEIGEFEQSHAESGDGEN